MGEWLAQHWFDLLQSLGIVGGLIFTGVVLRLDIRSRRITNLIDLTQGHREIWSQFGKRPELRRVIDPKVDIAKTGVTDAERIFVTLVIVHLNSVYHALDDALSIRPDHLREDVRSLFSLPVPRAVWEQVKPMQDRKFAVFVETCLSGEAVFSPRRRWRFFGRRGGHRPQM